MKTIIIPLWIAVCCTCTLFGASPFSGTFKGKEGTVRLTETGPGKFQGQFTAQGQTLDFLAQEKGSELVGMLNLEDEKLEFRMTVKGAKLTLVMEDETNVFVREPAAPDQPGKLAGTPAPRPSPSAPATRPANRSVRINGAEIPDQDVQKFEAEHRLKLPRGEFWYDKVSGAWGLAGGQTLGFTAPGLGLGGPLRTDASRGDTGVFINNRELPVADVVALQQLGVPVQRGRWWVDSRGDFGVENTAVAMGNIFQFSQKKGGAYQRATAGGYIGGDGQTSYFFDPKSGSSVMVDN